MPARAEETSGRRAAKVAEARIVGILRDADVVRGLLAFLYRTSGAALARHSMTSSSLLRLVSARRAGAPARSSVWTGQRIAELCPHMPPSEVTDF